MSPADRHKRLENKASEVGHFVIRILDGFGKAYWGKGLISKPYRIIAGADKEGDAPGYWQVKHKEVWELGVLVFLNDEPADGTEFEFIIFDLNTGEAIALSHPTEHSLKQTLVGIYETWLEAPEFYHFKEKMTLKVIMRQAIKLNITLIDIAFVAALGAIIGGMNGYLGGYVSVWATNEYVSFNVGPILGALKGMVVSFAATIIAGVGIIIGWWMVAALFRGLDRGGFGAPVYSDSGSILGWIGRPGPQGISHQTGCGVLAASGIIISPVIGAIAGFLRNRGTVLDPADVAITATGLVGLAGLILGAIFGFWSGKRARITALSGAWVGFVDGIIIGLLVGSFIEVLTMAAVGTIVGSTVGWLTTK